MQSTLDKILWPSNPEHSGLQAAKNVCCKSHPQIPCSTPAWDTFAFISYDRHQIPVKQVPVRTSVQLSSRMKPNFGFQSIMILTHKHHVSDHDVPNETAAQVVEAMARICMTMTRASRIWRTGTGPTEINAAGRSKIRATPVQAGASVIGRPHKSQDSVPHFALSAVCLQLPVWVMASSHAIHLTLSASQKENAAFCCQLSDSSHLCRCILCDHPARDEECHVIHHRPQTLSGMHEMVDDTMRTMMWHGDGTAIADLMSAVGRQADLNSQLNALCGRSKVFAPPPCPLPSTDHFIFILLNLRLKARYNMLVS